MVMNKIKINTAEEELYYKGKVIVQYVIEYPEIIETPYKIGMEKFNSENRRHAVKLKQFAQTQFYNKAKRNYEISIQNDNNKIIYKLINECNITYNFKNLITIFFNKSIFTGEINSSTIKFAKTWNLKI